MSTIDFNDAYIAANLQLQEWLASNNASLNGCTPSMLAQQAILAALPSIREQLAQQIEALGNDGVNQWIPDTAWGIDQAAEVVRG